MAHLAINRSSRQMLGVFTVACLAVFILIGGCSSGSSATPTATGASPGSGAPTPTSTSVAPPDSSSPTPTPTKIAPGVQELTILGPVDGSILETPWAVIVGQVRPDAVVSVNGETAAVEESGIFRKAVFLDEGANLVEVVASELLGTSASASLVLFYAPPAGGFPLEVFHPVGGFETSRFSVRISGGSAQDAVVTVNGTSASIDELGLFDTVVELDEGPNLIEVTASSQLSGNQQTISLIVFRVP